MAVEELHEHRKQLEGKKLVRGIKQKGNWSHRTYIANDQK
jgi:hypothetical protein